MSVGTPDTPPVVSIVGRKNSGKTTLTVALAAALKQRGYRVASVKHGHHAFEIDQPGRDSWRHFHEGGVEAVLLVGSDKLALVMRSAEAAADPVALVERFYAGTGYDLVLVEGFKYGPFPKVEIHRRAVHERPIYDLADASAAALFLGIVTDDAELRAGVPVITLDSAAGGASHVDAVVGLLEDRLIRRSRHGA